MPPLPAMRRLHTKDWSRARVFQSSRTLAFLGGVVAEHVVQFIVSLSNPETPGVGCSSKGAVGARSQSGVYRSVIICPEAPSASVVPV